MLVLSRKEGQALRIGEATVFIHQLRSASVVLAVEAPEHIQILRGELLEREPAAAEQIADAARRVA